LKTAHFRRRQRATDLVGDIQIELARIRREARVFLLVRLEGETDIVERGIGIGEDARAECLLEQRRVGRLLYCCSSRSD
jgi:hypothetical protein